MNIVKELLKNKGKEVWSLTPDSRVFDALEIMADKNIGAMPVLESEKIVGMFSERDYARKVILKGKASKNTHVNEIMSTKVYIVNPEQSIQECMALMTENRIRHLPVLDNGELVGLISIGDVVKAIISEQEFMMGQLENYITGDR